jgi:hypothetical protein
MWQPLAQRAQSATPYRLPRRGATTTAGVSKRVLQNQAHMHASDGEMLAVTC